MTIHGQGKSTGDAREAAVDSRTRRMPRPVKRFSVRSERGTTESESGERVDYVLTYVLDVAANRLDAS